MLCLVIVGFMIVIAYILISLIIYHESTDKNNPKIKFNTFKKFYEINPDRWKLSSDTEYKNNYVACYMTRHECSMLSTGYYGFRFGLIDYRRYTHWLNHMEKQKTDLKNMQLMADMIAVVKQDIEKLEHTSDQEIKQSKSIIEILCEV